MMSPLLKQLYDFNYNFPIYRLGDAPHFDVHTADPYNNYSWGGGHMRLMLQYIYTIAFLCLLRFDEVLKIQAHYLEVMNEATGEIKLILPFRKTHKLGGTNSPISAAALTSY